MTEYIDKIYGKIQIDEEIILELIKTEEFNKLKYIKQIGIPNEISNLPNFTRFEHSLGVYCILSKFNCSLKEKIVGLLHDVSHTAFSHTIDFILADSKKQDFQDNRHLEFIKNSSIGKVLENYNYDVEEISDLLRYPNVKTKDNGLNADRLDYGLREISYNEKFGIEYAKQCFENLTLTNLGYIFESVEYAKKFAKGFSESRNYYESFQRTVKFYLFSRFLKKAYDKDIINDFDFNLDDYRLMEKIFNSKDDVLLSIYNILKSDEKYFEIVEDDEDDEDDEDEIIFTKYRYVNPLYKYNDKILNLIDNDIEYKNEIENKKELYKNGIKFKVTNYYLKSLLK